MGERSDKVSKAFGALRKPIIRDSNLSLRTKKKAYKAVLLGVLLMALKPGQPRGMV